MLSVFRRLTSSQPIRQFSILDHKLNVTLLGKPNVGKSTMFNQLTGYNRSLIHPTPGLTRDCNDFVIYNTFETPIKLIDTPGIEFLDSLNKKKVPDNLRQAMDNIKTDIDKSDLVFFLIDGKYSINSDDRKIKDWLKKNFKSKEIVLVCNKCDNEDSEIDVLNDVYSFWDREVLFVSAENGNNMHALWERLRDSITEEKKSMYSERLKKREVKFKEFRKSWVNELKEFYKEEPKKDIDKYIEEFDMLNSDLIYHSDLDNDDIELDRIALKPKYYDPRGVTFDNRNKNMPISVAVIGRPNSGKSTFVNTLLKDNRVLTDEKQHTTRDPIQISTNFRGRRIELIDTAGLSKSLEQGQTVDTMVYYKNLSVIRQCQVHIIVADALTAFKVKDFDIIQQSCKEGRGVIVLVNKWDLMPHKFKNKAIKYMKDQIRRNLGSESSVPFVTASCLHNTGLAKIEDLILSVYEHWNARVSTGLLNNWLQKLKRITENDYKSLVKYKTVHNILYIVQIKTRPPTFAFFVNNIHMFKYNMTNFIKGKIVEEFGLYGVPVRIVYRGSVYRKMKKSLIRQMREQDKDNKNY